MTRSVAEIDVRPIPRCLAIGRQSAAQAPLPEARASRASDEPSSTGRRLPRQHGSRLSDSSAVGVGSVTGALLLGKGHDDVDDPFYFRLGQIMRDALNTKGEIGANSNGHDAGRRFEWMNISHE